MKKTLAVIAFLLASVLLMSGCGKYGYSEETGNTCCSSCGSINSSSSNFCTCCGNLLGSRPAYSTPAPPPLGAVEPPATPIPAKSWSSWSTSYPPPYAAQIESDYAVIGYNMVLYVTQQATGSHVRVFRSYSINGDYAGSNSRKSYGEYTYTKYVTCDELRNATAYSEGSMVENGYRGYQAGNGTAYYFGNDARDYVWFIESDVYGTVYRYK